MSCSGPCGADTNEDQIDSSMLGLPGKRAVTL